jgi:hypothetical protein
VYELPTVNPETVIGDEAAVPVNCAPLDASVATAKYAVIAEPPTLDGAVKVIDEPVAVPMVGALGFLSGSKNAEINPAGERSGMMPPY